MGDIVDIDDDVFSEALNIIVCGECECETWHIHEYCVFECVNCGTVYTHQEMNFKNEDDENEQ